MSVNGEWDPLGWALGGALGSKRKVFQKSRLFLVLSGTYPVSMSGMRIQRKYNLDVKRLSRARWKTSISWRKHSWAEVVINAQEDFSLDMYPVHVQLFRR